MTKKERTKRNFKKRRKLKKDKEYKNGKEMRTKFINKGGKIFAVDVPN